VRATPCSTCPPAAACHLCTGGCWTSVAAIVRRTGQLSSAFSTFQSIHCRMTFRLSTFALSASTSSHALHSASSWLSNPCYTWTMPCKKLWWPQLSPLHRAKSMPVELTVLLSQLFLQLWRCQLPAASSQHQHVHRHPLQQNHLCQLQPSVGGSEAQQESM